MRNSFRQTKGFGSMFAAGTAFVAAGASLLVPAQQASATPATLGFYPSTDIYPQGTFHLDLDTYGRALRTNTTTSAGLTYGFGPETDDIFGRTEAGADYILNSGVTPSYKRLVGNVKTQLFNNDASGTRVVTGVWGIGAKQIAAPNALYVLGSKTFSFGRVHAGLAHSLSSSATIRTPGGSDDKTSLQLGYDRYLSPKVQFAVDFYSGKNVYAGIQPTLYYYINPQANFGLGWFRANDSTVTPRNQIYVCFDYNFDFKSSSAPAATPAAE